MPAPNRSISSAICLLDRVVVPSFSIAAVRLAKSRKIGRIVQSAGALDQQPQSNRWKTMIFEYQNGQSIVEFEFNRLRKLDTQNIFRNRSLVLALDLAERDALRAGLGNDLSESSGAAPSHG